MKHRITISIILLSTLCHAQINLVEHFGNLCALGNSLVVRNDTIHIAGTTCVDIGNNQFSTSAFIAGYDMMGNLQYYAQVGDTLRGYRGEKLLMDSTGNKYILGTFSNDSSNNPTNIGVFVQKRNSSNQLLWAAEYQDSVNSSFYFTRDGALLPNGNIVLCGAHNLGTNIQPGVPDQDILFLVFDTSGTLITQKRIGDNQSQEDAWSMTVYDHNRLVLGSVKNFPGAEGNNWVLMIDYQGNVLDEYISASDDRIGVWDIVKTQDGGLACASGASNGNFSNYMVKSYVEKLDSNLNQVWEYTIDWRFSSSNLATSIDETPNGDIVIGGNVVDFLFDPDTAGRYGYLQKLSAQGDSIWYKAYTYYNNVTIRERHSLFDVQVTNDAIYFVGDANDFDTTPPPGQSMWLVSTDSNGIVSNLNERISDRENILVYPNPASDIVNIRICPDQGHSQIKVFDMQGQLHFEQRTNSENTPIDLSDWPSGMYIYHIQNEDGVVRGKFLKN